MSNDNDHSKKKLLKRKTFANKTQLRIFLATRLRVICFEEDFENRNYMAFKFMQELFEFGVIPDPHFDDEIKEKIKEIVFENE